MLDPAVLRDIPWMHDALCTEPRYDRDAWFPRKAGKAGTSVAKAICQQCPAQNACLAYAVSEDIRYGIWGGATPAERQANRGAGRARTHAVVRLSR
jgi:WhiB family transcriptional regulator, redox-sensing transcriptional regulator